MSSAPRLKSIPLDDPAIDHAHHDFVQVGAGLTIAQALDDVRAAKPPGRIVYFYAVDEEGRLVGVVPTRRLLLGSPNDKVGDVMVRDPVTLSIEATVADACEMFFRHRFLALPIVGPGRRLLGVIDVELYADELSDLARREEAEDLFQLIGVRLQEVRSGSLKDAIAGRFPWLMCNVCGGLACAVLGGMYDALLQKVVALALFIPVVLAVAESVSIQSLTLTLQGHHGLRVGWREWLRSLRREASAALPLGLLCGLFVAIAALLWHRDVRLSVVLVLTLAVAVLAAGVYGRLVPATLGLLRRDPKVSSGPIVLATTDLTALLAYMSIATWLLA
jgi:magnesium transporter